MPKLDNIKAREYRKANPNVYKKIELKRRYGITLEEYNNMYMIQLGLCAVCHEPFGDKSPDVEHCHTSNKVRGLVHHNCNAMLGYSGDSVEKLALGIEYLKSHRI